MNSVIVNSSRPVTPAEIIDLQNRAGSEGWGVGNQAVWQDAIDRAVAVAAARNRSGDLIGIGFLIGNLRHGEITDLVVDPAFRGQGIGHQITNELIGQVKVHGIRYVTLVRDPSSPFLQSFYESAGFDSLDFAMGLVNE